jgi:hypothetical protein
MDLAAYRKKFYGGDGVFSKKKSMYKTNDIVQEFIATFCEHNLADTDYSVIQQEPLEFESLEQWITQASLSSILQCLTYFIWTDKIVEGYFKARIENGIMEKLLRRLETLLKEEIVIA